MSMINDVNEFLRGLDWFITYDFAYFYFKHFQKTQLKLYMTDNKILIIH